MNPATEDLLAFCRAFTILERDAVCCGDVSVAQCVALQLLFEEDHDVTTLANRTGVTKGAVTRLVDGLEERGWTRKRSGKLDRRRAVISLTATGRRKAEELRNLTEVSVDRLLSAIPPEKRVQVVESMHLLRKALEGVCAVDSAVDSRTSSGLDDGD